MFVENVLTFIRINCKAICTICWWRFHTLSIYSLIIYEHFYSQSTMAFFKLNKFESNKIRFRDIEEELQGSKVPLDIFFALIIWWWWQGLLSCFCFKSSNLNLYSIVWNGQVFEAG